MHLRQYGFVRFFRLKMHLRQYEFVRFFRLKMHLRQYGFVRFFRLKMHLRQYGFVRFFRLKKSPREFTQGSRHFCAFQQDMRSDESSTRVCLPSLCQASYNSLSFSTALYIHGDIYFATDRDIKNESLCIVRHPIYYCPSLLRCTYTLDNSSTHTQAIRIAIAKLKQQRNSTD
jgi:hypothetical protein